MKALKKLLNEKFKEMFALFCGDMIVINFDDKIKYSLHAQCFVRVTCARKILFTTSDVHFNPDRTQKCEEEKDGNLLEYNMNIVNSLLQNAVVTKVKYNKVGDVAICFDNDVVIELIQDCLFVGFEYYRFISYSPYYDEENLDQDSTHYVCELINDVLTEREDRDETEDNADQSATDVNVQ